jgi:hypothetical protein
VSSVERQVRNGRARWQARWRDDTGQQRKKTFDRKVDADKFLTSVEHGILSGTYVDPHDGTTVAEYARSWAAARPHRASTARRVSGL